MYILNLAFSETAMIKPVILRSQPESKLNVRRYVMIAPEHARDVVTLVVAIDRSRTYILDVWSSSHSTVACYLACNNNLSAVASYIQRFFATVVVARVKIAGWDSNENNCCYIKSAKNKTVKRFLIKSTGCRDFQHTGLQSTQTRRNYSSNNTSKQSAQTRGIFELPRCSA